MYTLYLLQFVIYITLSSSTLFDKLIYKNLNPDGYCVRRFNATSEMGCASAGIGLVQDGQMYLNGNVSAKDTLVLLMPVNLFYLESTQNKIISDGRVAGILLHDFDSAAVNTPISDDMVSPNCNSGLYNVYGNSTCARWNPHGMSTIFRKYPFPIMLLRERKDEKSLRACIQNHPTNCYVQLEKEMIAVGNSVICMRRNNIQHLLELDMGGTEIRHGCVPATRSTLHTHVGRDENASIVLITRSDTTDLFPQVPSGFGSPGSGLVVFLSTARQISAQNVSVAMLIFGAESLDYSSSTKYLMDNQFQWKDVVEIGQMAFSDKIFLHSDIRDNWSNDVKERNQKMMDRFLRRGFSPSTASQLPPCTIQNLLRTQAISHLFLSDYDKEYNNKFYHSYLDGAENHNRSIDRFVKQAQVISEAVLNWTNTSHRSGQPSADEEEEDRKFTADLYNCMFISMNCTLLKRLTTGFNVSVDLNGFNRPMNFHPFGGHYDFAMLTLLVRYASAKSDKLELPKIKCLNAGGAFIPADDENPSRCIVNHEFHLLDPTPPNFTADATWPLWTESLEGGLVARCFLKDTLPDWVPFLLGVVVTVVTTPFVWIVSH